MSLTGANPKKRKYDEISNKDKEDYGTMYLNSWHSVFNHPNVSKIPYDEKYLFYPEKVSFLGGMWFNYTNQLNERYSHRLLYGTYHNKVIFPSKFGYNPNWNTIRTLRKYMLVFVYKNNWGYYDYNPAVQESGTKKDFTFEEIIDRGIKEELGYKIKEIIPGSKKIMFNQKRRNIMFVAVEPKNLEYLDGIKPFKNYNTKKERNDKKRKVVIYITSDNYQELVNIAKTWKPFIQTENKEIINTVGLGIKLTSHVIEEFRW
jgi:hypothetical protein